MQGERDWIVLPAAADYIASKVKHVKKSYYPNVGHAPLLEDPERLTREMAKKLLPSRNASPASRRGTGLSNTIAPADVERHWTISFGLGR